MKVHSPRQSAKLSSVKQVSGVPVVKSDTDYTLVGVLSKKDLSKKGASVKDIMTSPPIAARPDNKVADAACLMLKHKVTVLPLPANCHAFMQN